MTARKPSAISGMTLIVKRELGQYFKTWSGYIIAASMLLLTGILFNAFAVGSTSKYSGDVLSDYFFFISGTTMVAGLLFAMRQIAEERQMGTLPLLTTSSLTEGQIVLAKFISAYALLLIFLSVTVYMPGLIIMNGKISLGHVATGYIGLALLGAASVSIGMFGSAAVKSQLVALVISAAILVVMLLLWMTARLVDGALGDVIAQLALHDKHFRPFMEGKLSVENVVYYVSVSAFFLMLARNFLETRRWRA